MSNSRDVRDFFNTLVEKVSSFMNISFIFIAVQSTVALSCSDNKERCPFCLSEVPKKF